MKKHILGLITCVLCCAMINPTEGMRKPRAKNTEATSMQLMNLSGKEIILHCLTSKRNSVLDIIVRHLAEHQHLTSLKKSGAFVDPIEVEKDINQIVEEIDRLEDDLLALQQESNEESNTFKSEFLERLQLKIENHKKSIGGSEEKRDDFLTQLAKNKAKIRKIWEMVDKRTFATMGMPFVDFHLTLLDTSIEQPNSCSFCLSNINNVMVVNMFYIPQYFEIPNILDESFDFFEFLNTENQEIYKYVREAIIPSITLAQYIGKSDNLDIIIIKTARKIPF